MHAPRNHSIASKQQSHSAAVQHVPLFLGNSLTRVMAEQPAQRLYRHNWLTFVYTVATQFPTLDYSHGWIPLFSFAEEYGRTKVTRHTNDELTIIRRRRGDYRRIFTETKCFSIFTQVILNLFIYLSVICTKRQLESRFCKLVFTVIFTCR